MFDNLRVFEVPQVFCFLGSVSLALQRPAMCRRKTQKFSCENSAICEPFWRVSMNLAQENDKCESTDFETYDSDSSKLHWNYIQ